jgi:predicted nucleic acid-binding protein
MKLLIDTNVVIDFLADRAPFADEARAIIAACVTGRAMGVVTASAVTDIYYILRKTVGRQTALSHILLLLETFEIAEVGKRDLHHALKLPMADFEDALAATCAQRLKADAIVSRNTRDFHASPIPALTPKAVLDTLA